ncbi:MAG: ATPase [Gammaproteobacteria bacterium]|jgi:uncharacterized membrane protein YraQ (UPF0718 family)|nr:ATPase [Gammaproteobacteria bacterium]MBT6043314.1 ATPase [Gammaproteobacteria bacterium]
MTEHSCHPPANKPDILLRISGFSIVFLYFHFTMFEASTHFALWYNILAASVFDLVNTMWWGVTIGILMISVLARIPREFVISILGTTHGLSGILRATAAGVLLDLCSHGILMVGAKLYERGASIGQVTAFLIASPWNSFSLTLVLIALVGLWWALCFIVLSMLIAIIVGLIFDELVKRGTLPANPQQIDLPNGFRFWASARQAIKETQFSAGFIGSTLKNGIKESRMVMRWILFGVILASLIRAFVAPEIFGTWFGPTLTGLGLTIIVATILEVCSEGSTPIAADLLTRANAPGNGFAFLMTGVSTDYTEIMVLRETTRSWKIALFLPLLTVPQVLVVAWLLNTMAV